MVSEHLRHVKLNDRGFEDSLRRAEEERQAAAREEAARLAEQERRNREDWDRRWAEEDERQRRNLEASEAEARRLAAQREAEDPLREMLLRRYSVPSFPTAAGPGGGGDATG